MFEGTTFLIVTSPEYKENSHEVFNIVSRLREKSGLVVILREDEQVPDLKEANITHIISRTIDFSQYVLARASMIPVSTPEWALASLEQNRCLNPKPYTPDASCILKDCFVCVADNLPAGDKQVIYDIVRAFGGSYLDVLTRYTTHLIAPDLSSEKSIIAASVAASPSPDNIDIKIILPRWLDDCLLSGKMVDELPYTLPCTTEPSPLDVPLQSDLLQGKIVYISSDYNMSEKQWCMIQRLLRRSGGQISHSFDSSINVYVGKFRQGSSFISASANPDIAVGNLQWLLHVTATQKWILPIDSNLLHYPVPIEPLESFKGLKISVTNYSGDARAYLAQLITSLGGDFTKTLTRNNDFLVAAAPVGRKYETAKFKWVGENNSPTVRIVNHAWLEDCYAEWLMLDLEVPKYQCFGHNTIPLATTKLDFQVLEKWWLLYLQLSNEKLEPTNVADSMSEDESTQSKNGLGVEVANHELEDEKFSKIVPPESQDVTAADASDDGQLLIADHQDGHDATVDMPKNIDNINDVEETPYSPVSNNTMSRRYGGRLAALRAALKLHENMSDLNEFNESKKSARKMQSYMEQMHDENSSKRRTPSPNNTPVKRAKSSHEPSIEGPSKPFDIVAIITGCENIIKPSKRELARLASIGIIVASDFLPELTFTTVIAPKVLRTEKFLRSLSTATQILHPSFLVEVLQGMDSNSNTTAAFDSRNYMLNKMVPVSEINAELGQTGAEDALSEILGSPLKGRLFKNMSINLSANLNGGPSTISRILSDHGAKECVPIKTGLSAAALKKLLVATEGMPVLCVLVAHKTKDAKLIANFKHSFKDGAVVDWDWCVKSIFKMHLKPLASYSL